MISIYFIFPAFPLFLSFLGGVSMLIHVIYPIFMSSYRHTVFGDLKLANRSGRSPFSVQDTPWGETKQPFLFPATWRLKKTCGKIEWTLPQPCLQTYSKYIISIYIYIANPHRSLSPSLYRSSSAKLQEATGPPLPPGWVRVPHEGDHYYWNTQTNEAGKIIRKNHEILRFPSDFSWFLLLFGWFQKLSPGCQAQMFLLTSNSSTNLLHNRIIHS